MDEPVDEPSDQPTGGRDARRRGLQFFGPDNPVLPPRSGHGPEGDLAARTAAGVPTEWPSHGGSDAGVLFFEPGADPDRTMNVSFVDMAPHYIIPRHSHDNDCLYYVTRGELHLGNRVVRAGEGMFVPAHAPYGYQVGPDGAHVLEFQAAIRGREATRWYEDDAGWQRVLDNARAHHDDWADAGYPAP